MRRLMPIILLAAIVALPPIGLAQAADRDHPAVVELYQSQGCSSCPPADLVLNAIADRPDVLALNFAVTYWDDLGWKDIFAQPAFTRRQWDFAHAGNRGQVATPQVVVNGRGLVTGNRREEVDAAVARFDRGPAGPSIAVEGHDALIGDGKPAGAATIWLVRYDPRTIAVPIRAGENAGRTIAHRNVVRALTPIGTWRGAALRLAIPAGPDGLASAILLQQGVGGPIVAARRI